LLRYSASTLEASYPHGHGETSPNDRNWINPTMNEETLVLYRKQHVQEAGGDAQTIGESNSAVSNQPCEGNIGRSTGDPKELTAF
jgi:hypothetical protein